MHAPHGAIRNRQDATLIRTAAGKPPQTIAVIAEEMFGRSRAARAGCVSRVIGRLRETFGALVSLADFEILPWRGAKRNDASGIG